MHQNAGHKTLGIDIDGVCVDFVKSFCALMVKLTGQDLFRNGQAGLGPDFPNTWDFHFACGYTKEENNQIWDHIAASTIFWYELEPLGGILTIRNAFERLNKARFDGHDIYFITNRAGKEAKMQTEGWLRNMGAMLPTVMLSADKATAVKAVGCTAYIDDRLRNCNEVIAANPQCRVYLKEAPYNDRPVADVMPIVGEQRRDPRLIPVPTLADFLTKEGF